MRDSLRDTAPPGYVVGLLNRSECGMKMGNFVTVPSKKDKFLHMFNLNFIPSCISILHALPEMCDTLEVKTLCFNVMEPSLYDVRLC